MSSVNFKFIILAFAVLGALFVWRKMRQHKIQGLEFLVWLSVCIGAAFFSVFPEILVEIFKFFPLAESSRYDRLIQMSFMLSFGTLALVFYYRGKNYDLKDKLVRVAQDPVVRNFVRSHQREVGSVELLVLIPALNEEKNLGSVLDKLEDSICGLRTKALVISDGSTDGTLALAIEKGAWAVEHPTNFGGGMALKTGYKIAPQMGVKYVVTVDADGQYQSDQIERLIHPLRNGTADVTSGSRFLGEYEQKLQKNHVIRTIGVVFFNHFLTILTGQKITDSSSGMRATTVENLKLLNMQQLQFHSSEFLLESIKNGLRFVEVPITFAARISGESKKPKTMKYAFGFSGAVIRSWLRPKKHR